MEEERKGIIHDIELSASMQDARELAMIVTSYHHQLSESGMTDEALRSALTMMFQGAVMSGGYDEGYTGNEPAG